MIELSLIPCQWEAIHINKATGTQGKGGWQCGIRVTGVKDMQWAYSFGFNPVDAFTKAIETITVEEDAFA